VSDAPVARVERVLPAAPDVVFDQWLDPDALTDWMCPRPARVVDVTVDARIGGALRMDVDDSGTSVLISGQFLAIERPRLLRFTWSNSNWADPSVVSVVAVAFAPHGAGETLMSIEHSLLPATEFGSFQRGWAATADQLAVILER
jgi:uncharacterized protein YndB with AHSA1/START domain